MRKLIKGVVVIAAGTAIFRLMGQPVKLVPRDQQHNDPYGLEQLWLRTAHDHLSDPFSSCLLPPYGDIGQ